MSPGPLSIDILERAANQSRGRTETHDSAPESPSPSSEGAKVLVVDDDDDVRRFVAAVLKLAQYNVVAVSNGFDAIAVAAKERPDLVVLDLGLPGISGLDVCSGLRSWFRGAILVLSSRGETSTVIEALDRGADDYLKKPLDRGEFLARLRALRRRTNRERRPEPVLTVGELSIDVAQRKVAVGGQDVHINRMEFKILTYLATNSDKVVQTQALIAHVWGEDRTDCGQTLRVHVGRIRKKLGLSSSSNVTLSTEPGVGYRLACHAEDVTAK